ncbi:hypothetical protein L9F63_025504, partial [Diploptera punctata]
KKLIDVEIVQNLRDLANRRRRLYFQDIPLYTVLFITNVYGNSVKQNNCTCFNCIVVVKSQSADWLPVFIHLLSPLCTYLHLSLIIQLFLFKNYPK